MLCFADPTAIVRMAPVARPVNPLQQPLRDGVGVLLHFAACVDHYRGQRLQETAAERAAHAPAMVCPITPKECSSATAEIACALAMPVMIRMIKYR